MTGNATKGSLITLWIIALLIGFAHILKCYFFNKKIYILFQPKSINVFQILMILGVLTNLVAATAPSTKIDELNYHMLLPSRILSDQALIFYRYPIEGAAYPHMIYQFAMTPFHAIGYQDSGNVLSMFINLTLVGFSLTLIRNNGASQTWQYLWLAPLCIGMYPVIWQVTGGAFAFGDLATSGAILALLLRKDILLKLPTGHYALLFSFLVLCSVCSKVSLIPMGIFLLIFNGYCLLKNINSRIYRMKIILFMIIPWIIFYLPILFWTWRESGSPFGPFLAGKWLMPSVYPLAVIQDQLNQIREINLPTIMGAIQSALIDYTPLLWCGVILIFFERTITLNKKILISAFIAIQTVVVLRFLIFDLRFFGGLIQGLTIYFAIMASFDTQQRYTNKKYKVLTIMVLLLLPWLSIQIYYASQFIGIVTGFENKNEFYKNKTSFYKDYQEINRIVPKDAVILFRGPVRLSSVYAPRAVFFSEEDIPPDKNVVLMIVDGNLKSGNHFGYYVCNKELYVNKKAITDVYRTPGLPPRTRLLKVFQLIKTAQID